MTTHRGSEAPNRLAFRFSVSRCLGVSCLMVFVAAAALAQRPALDQAAETETAWTCPMHPDYTMEASGKCPRCGMDLVRAAAFDVRDYPLQVETVPALVRPGQKAALRFKAFHPGTGAAVTRFVPVHEKEYTSSSSARTWHFEHIHPEMRPDGTWTIDVTLPKPG